MLGVRVLGRRREECVADSESIDVAVLPEIASTDGYCRQPLEHSAASREIILGHEHAAHEESVLRIAREERDAAFEPPEQSGGYRQLRVEPVVVVQLRGDRIHAEPLARVTDRKVA